MRHLLSSILEPFYPFSTRVRLGNTCARFVNVLTVHKQNWLDIKEKHHAATHYHRKRNVKSWCHRSRTWKRHHHHHLSTNTVPNLKTLLYNTGVVSEHIRVTDRSSHATTSDWWRRTSEGWNLVIFSQLRRRRLKLTFLMASFFEIGHLVDTDIIIALVTDVVDTSTNLAWSRTPKLSRISWNE